MLLCVERPELHTLNTDVMYINVGTGNPNCSRMPKATIRFKDSRMTTLSVSVLHVNNLSFLKFIFKFMTNLRKKNIVISTIN